MALFSTTTKGKAGLKAAKFAASAGKLGLRVSKPFVKRRARQSLRRTAPRVAAGALIGATAVYFLEPEAGPQRREKLAELIS